jgi:hypothetical protein
LHNTFGGVGLLALSTEAVICRINLFVQHWGMESQLGSMLRTSMEYLHLEAGCAECPLSINYEPLGPIITHSWLRSFWECISKFDIHLELDYPALQLPRENDITIMAIAIALGYVGDNLHSINRCRLACCCIFLSCVAGANGRYLDPLCGQPGIYYSASSTFTFPKEKPARYGGTEKFHLSVSPRKGIIPDLCQRINPTASQTSSNSRRTINS